jgi:hypothetical protein
MSISAANATQAALPFGFSPPAPATMDVHGTVSSTTPASFLDRRAEVTDAGSAERRQFGSSHSDLSPDARELATAIDRYKLEFRRRYITCEEMLAVVKSLGYHREQ